MPVDASTFLAGLAESRCAAQIAARSGFFTPSPGLTLPDSLEVALRHRFLLTPTLARSRLATTSRHLYVPSSEREQLEYWHSQFGDDANWLLHLGPSNLVAVEIDPALARHSLALLADDDPPWWQSLRFADGNKWQVLFEAVDGLPSLKGYPGLRLNAGSSLLIPPSFVSGIQLAYEYPRAPLLSADCLCDAVIPL